MLCLLHKEWKCTNRAHLTTATGTGTLRVSSRAARTETSSGDVGLAALLHAEALVKLGRREDASQGAARAVEALRNGVGPVIRIL
jgi:hypothetical protein